MTDATTTEVSEGKPSPKPLQVQDRWATDRPVEAKEVLPLPLNKLTHNDPPSSLPIPMTDAELKKFEAKQKADKDTNFNLSRAILAKELNIPEGDIIQYITELELKYNVPKDKLLNLARTHFSKRG